MTFEFGVDSPAPPSVLNAAVAIGNFDGVHVGHHRLLAVLRAESRRLRVPAVAVCLSPHPLSLLRPESAPATLLWPERRAELLRASGADAVAFLKTTPELLSLAAEEFFSRVLIEKLQIKAIVEGENFRFGRGRKGDVALLEGLCRSANIPMTTVPLADDDDATVSSTRIREAVARGDLEEAADLAGRRHRIRGIVGVGAKRGRTVGFPTANLNEPIGLVPAHGVYAVIATLDDGRRVAGACNVGPNPTFGETASKVEVHLLDYSGDLYGADLEVEFLRRLRDVRTFGSVKDLVAQITLDAAAAKDAFDSLPPDPILPELAATVAEWVRWETAPSLSPVRTALVGAEFVEPQVLRLDWRLDEPLPPHVVKDLLFGLEERLRVAFPEVDHVVSSTVNDRRSV